MIRHDSVQERKSRVRRIEMAIMSNRPTLEPLGDYILKDVIDTEGGPHGDIAAKYMQTQRVSSISLLLFLSYDGNYHELSIPETAVVGVRNRVVSTRPNSQWTIRHDINRVPEAKK